MPERQNQNRLQRRLAVVFSMLSPFNSATIVSMDLARTSFVQLEKIEDAVRDYMPYHISYTRDKAVVFYSHDGQEKLTDFAAFDNRDTDSVGVCLVRNLFPILNLALLSILGFAGAYVSILRYDVR